MSLLGVKSSSNILIKKRIWSGKEKNTAENQGVTHSRQRASSLYFYYQAFRPVKHMHYGDFPRDLLWFMKSRSLVNPKWAKKEKDIQSDDKKSCKELKDKS